MISRLRLLLALMLSVLVLFTGRLMYLQLARAEDFALLSEENFTQEQRIAPLRGRILARDGTVLADNRVAYDLMYWGGEIDGWSRLKALLALEDEPRPPDLSKLEEELHGAVLAWNIPDVLVPAVEERVAGQPNLYLRERVERTYPTNLAAHVVGYTSQADPERFPGYTVEDLVGISGVEASFETTLFGSPGARLVQVDNRGVELLAESLATARPGQDVVLTIDPQVQRLAEDVLRDSLVYINEQRDTNELPHADLVRGALIAINPKNGEILAMASAPSFDQNVFTKRPSDPDAVRTILEDRVNLPLQNRAIEAYPPASTFKIVSSSTLLEHGYLAPGTHYECTAGLPYGGRVWENWANYYRGSYNVAEAIGDSCNTFFWRAALNTPDFSMGWSPFIRDLVARAYDFGYGERVEIGLLDEKPGTIPDETWVRQQTGEPWYPGYTLNTTIGQGFVLATPLQTVQFVSTLALGGRQVKPRLVREIGGIETPIEAEQIDGQFWHVLRDGMRRMVTDHGANYIIGPGVGFPVAVAGKTGTAQNGLGEGYEHVWFMAYGPMEDPEVAVVVFLEGGGSSSAVAVPVIRDFLAAYWGIDLEGND